MSRAFVKEDDLEHAGIDVPERPISSEKNYVTPNGHKELEVKIAFLEEERAKSSLNSDSIYKQKNCDWSVILGILSIALNQQFW